MASGTIRRKKNNGRPRGVHKRATLTKQAQELIEGTDDVKTWSDEELMNGRRDGFLGDGGALGPNIIPIEVHHELARRVMSRAQHSFVAELEYTVQKLFAIIAATDVEKPTRSQIKAMELVIDRVLGKAVEKVEIHSVGELPWEKMFANAIVANAKQLQEYEENKSSSVIEVDVIESEE